MGDIERKTYITTIVQEKPPLESIELIKLRLNESRGINSSLIDFFEEYLAAQQSYATKLNSVLLKGTKLFDDSTKFNKELDTLGLFEPIWNSLIGEINAELKYVDNKTKALNLDMLSKLHHFDKKYKGNSENLNNLRRLGYRLQKLSSTPNRNASQEQELELLSREWESRVPNFVEIVENYDFNRFILLKDVFLSLQSTNQDGLPELTKLTEKSLEFVLNFDPNDEIQRFANEVRVKNIQFDESALIAEQEEKRFVKAEKHHTFRGGSSNNKSRHASTMSNATVATSATDNTLLNNGFTDSSKSKEKHKLKSRVGSIFGRKKKDKKAGSGSKLPGAIAESPIASNNTSRSSLPLANNTTTTPPPPLQQQASSSSAADRRTSAVSSDLYQQSSASAQQQQQRQLDSTAVTGETQQKPPQLDPRLSYSSQPLTPTARIPTDTTGTGDYHTAKSDAHVPPPVPVARGTGTFNGSSSSATTAHDEPQQLGDQVKKLSLHHGAVPPPPPQRQRRDIQSGLFVGLDVTQDPGNNQQQQPPIYESHEGTPASSGEPSLARQVTGASSIARQTTGALPPASFTHPDLVHPGLNSSLAEVVNATYKDNELVKGNVVSELAFSYIVGAEVTKLPSSIRFTFAQAAQLGKLLVNNQFIRQRSETEFEVVDVSAIHLKTVGAIKYTLPIQTSVISVLPVWRFEPHQASVVISIKLSPEVLELLLPAGKTLVFSNFIVSVSIAGANATSAATRPTGSFNKDKARVTWVYTGPVTLGHDKEERIIARLATDGLAHEAEAGVQVKFTLNNEDGAALVTTPVDLHSKNVYGIDPFDSNADVASTKDGVVEDDWKLVPTVKTLIAGRYEGHA